MTQHITGHDIFGESLQGQLVLHCCVPEGSTTLTGYQTSSCHAASRRRAIQSPMQKYQAGVQKSQASARRVKSEAQITDLERGGWPEAV